MRRSAAAIASLMACCWALLLGAHEARAVPSPPEAADYIGATQCKACHAVIRGHFAHTRHALVFEVNPETSLERRGCEACHGPGAAHRANPAARNSIVNFQQDSDVAVSRANAQCLQCHDGGARLHWFASAHERNALACSDCHNPMSRFGRSGLLRSQSVNAVCTACHQAQDAQFRKRSHMPLHEGKISCVDCHEAHGSAGPRLVRAGSVNELCYDCHQEKRGPFVWEHAPVRENCLACHEAHGSNHEFLLTRARPFLCQSCHAQGGHVSELLTPVATATGAAPDARAIGRSCQNCHAQIHGSNHPAGVRMHR